MSATVVHTLRHRAAAKSGRYDAGEPLIMVRPGRLYLHATDHGLEVVEGDVLLEEGVRSLIKRPGKPAPKDITEPLVTVQADRYYAYRISINRSCAASGAVLLAHAITTLVGGGLATETRNWPAAEAAAQRGLWPLGVRTPRPDGRRVKPKIDVQLTAPDHVVLFDTPWDPPAM